MKGFLPKKETMTTVCVRYDFFHSLFQPVFQFLFVPKRENAISVFRKCISRFLGELKIV